MLIGVVLGEKQLHIVIQQFANDTMDFLLPSMDNVLVLKSALRCYEVAFELTVNFHKSRLAGIRVEGDLVARFTRLLNCATMVLPFTFLSILVGADPRMDATWILILENLRKKLTPLK